MNNQAACAKFSGILYCCQTCGQPASDHEQAPDTTHVSRNLPCDSFNRDRYGSPYCESCGWTDVEHPGWARDDESAPEGLSLWWEGIVAMDIARTVPKLKEYGSRDLEAMGTTLGRMRGLELTPAQASIYGCVYYALGKTVRAIAALERGESPSEDTLFDLSIYSMMARAFQAGEL